MKFEVSLVNSNDATNIALGREHTQGELLELPSAEPITSRVCVLAGFTQRPGEAIEWAAATPGYVWLIRPIDGGANAINARQCVPPVAWTGEVTRVHTEPDTRFSPDRVKNVLIGIGMFVLYAFGCGIAR